MHASLPSIEQVIDYIMTNLAEHGYAAFAVPNADPSDPAAYFVCDEEIRKACRDEGVQVRFRHRDSDGAWEVRLRKVGRGH